MLTTDILDLLIKESINFSNYFEKIKPSFIECLSNFLNSKLMHSAYDLIIKKEKIASLNEETISYFLNHISFKPLFNYKDTYSIYPEPLEIVINTSFTFKDLHPVEIKNYYLLKLNNLFFSIISSIQEFLTYYKYYIHPNKNHIRILEKKMETIKKVNLFKESNFNLKKTNFVFNSFNWNKDLNTFNAEIEKCHKLKNEVSEIFLNCSKYNSLILFNFSFNFVSSFVLRSKLLISLFKTVFSSLLLFCPS